MLMIWEINPNKPNKAGFFESSFFCGVNLTPLFHISKKANPILI